MGIYEIKKPRKINSLSVTIFGLIAGILYFGAFFLPVWWPVFELTNIMRGICNDAYRELDNDKLMDKLLKSSRRTGLRVTADNFQFVRVPYKEYEYPPGLDNDGHNLFERRGKECQLTLNYTSQAQWPLLDKQTPIIWNRSVKTDLQVVKY